MKEQIFKYFDESSYPSGTNKTNWCAAFVNWCFEQTDEFKGTNPVANVAAYDWLPPAKAKSLRDDVDGWINEVFSRQSNPAPTGWALLPESLLFPLNLLP